jgi:hypothetical protein
VTAAVRDVADEARKEVTSQLEKGGTWYMKPWLERKDANNLV